MPSHQETIIETDVFHVYWYNTDQTIIISEVKRAWGWEDAYTLVNTGTEHIAAQPHPVYSIMTFTGSATLIPHQGGIANLRQLMIKNPPNEKLTIFVGISTITRTFMEIASKIYGLSGVLAHYRFVKSFEEALAIVEKDRNIS